MNRNILLILTLFILAVGAVVFIWWSGPNDEEINVPQNTMQSWMRYEDETLGFSFLYPDDWYLYNEESDYALVSVSSMSPDDPRRPSGASLISSFTVRLLQEENIEA